MNKTEHLLTILAEECAEVAQRASKAVRFGISEIQPGQAEDNQRRLERELAELMAVAELLGLHVREEDKAAKREKLKKYMDYSREIGTLEGRAVEALLSNAVREERERYVKLVEARRQKVLANPADPSWTEHFAELQTEIRNSGDRG